MNLEKSMEEGTAGLDDGSSPATSPTLTQDAAAPIGNHSHSAPPCSHSTLDADVQHGKKANIQRAIAWLRSLKRKQPKAAHKKPFRPKQPGRNINRMPQGYPTLAAFMSNDDGYTIYRRFGYLQSRLLLRKQAKLCDLEMELDELEEEAAKLSEDELTTYVCRGWERERRKELMQEIETTYCSYSNLLTSAQQMMNFHRPAKSDYNSLRRHVRNRSSFSNAEARWAECEDDMLTIRGGREHAWLDDVVESLLKLLYCPLIDWIFCSNETRQKNAFPVTGSAPPHGSTVNSRTRKPCEIYLTPSRVALLASGILFVLILALFIAPIYVLFNLCNNDLYGRSYTISIGVMLVFTLTFSATLSLFTKAKRHEILAAAAGYCAVLVVFLGNVQKT